MKQLLAQKWIRVFALLLAVVGVAFYLENHVSPKGQRVYHHIQAANAAYCDPDTVEGFCTHLPLVVIDTANQAIGVTSEIMGDIRVIDNSGGHNHLDSVAAVESHMRIKIRGNSSLRFDKKQYRVTMVEADDELKNRNLSLLGMSRDSDWVLNGPYLDKTMLRNYLMYNLAGEIMEWSPNVRYCEVFLNGEYQGLYLLIEAVKAAPGRVEITEVIENQPATGYLLARERPDETKYALNNFGTYSKKTYNEIGIAYPNNVNRNENNSEYVRQNIGAFEKMLYSIDYDDTKQGYANWIDIQSFVDYYILNEFSLNIDAGGLSTYAYKDIRSKIKMGPVWDFNNTYDNYQYYAHDPYDLYMMSTNWYVMLLKDEVFVETIIDRYYELRQHVLNEDRIMQLLDDTITWLGPAIDRNFELWGYSFDMDLLNGENPYTGDADRDLNSYEEAVAQLKNCIKVRGRFLDEYIVILRQFCAESAIKEWN